MGEFDKAMHYHQMAYDISENHEDMDGKVIFYSLFIEIIVWLWLNFEQGSFYLDGFFLAVLNLFIFLPWSLKEVESKEWLLFIKLDSP